MFLYFLVSIPVRAYAHIYIYIYIKEVIKTEATKRKQCHTLDDSVSTIAMNLEKKNNFTQQAIGHYKTTSK